MGIPSPFLFRRSFFLRKKGGGWGLETRLGGLGDILCPRTSARLFSPTGCFLYRIYSRLISRTKWVLCPWFFDVYAPFLHFFSEETNFNFLGSDFSNPSYLSRPDNGLKGPLVRRS